MADTPNDNGTLAETPNESFVRDREAHFRSSSDTDVEVDDVDEERGKDHIQKRLALTFQNVTVRVTAPDEALGETLWSRVDPRQLGGLFTRSNRPKRTILHDVSGQVNPGEMLLVLGRPGSGCTSLLRVLSNHREAFQEVTGQARYGSMNHVEATKFRQQIVFNTEDDIHFPTLTVNQTMKFALRNKVPRERPDHVEKKHHFVQDMRNHILDSLGIGHTQKTLVGNEFIRGVSGGERKRVSLVEVMASQSPLQFWDQPTRGLESKTALEFVETLRRDADRNAKSVVVTTYQAGNGIFDSFDKVLVLAEGRVIYYGLREAAKAYFEDMGFVCPRGANVADFLTSVTVQTEREIAPGFEDRVPNTAEEFEDAYKRSETCQLMRQLLQQPENMRDQVEDLQMAVQREKRQRRWRLGKRDVYTAGLREQVINCTRRQWQIMMGDRLSLTIKVISAIIQALVCGSLFYNLPLISESVFLWPGVLFFPILYFLLKSI
ncbi:ATPase [Fusarium albosuccineum]|uniref:ATPase n=1 Tax=Fusarium albosuccineum TaxID=1237068 RepID=A0A8H4K8K1_9HYPO|nr:ATPase [Fusarium albosuccineum]